MKLRLSDLELIVPNVEKAVAFYKDVLGLTMRFRNENFADFDLGYGARLAIWERSHAGQTCGEEALGPQGNHMMGAIRLVSKEAVDQAHQEFEKKEVTIAQKPQHWPWGAYAFYFKDPNGYLWEVYYWETQPRTL